MDRKYSKDILCSPDGRLYAEIYTDDDGASGYGGNPMIGRWYGTRAECEAVDPATVPLRPMGATGSAIDEFDLACERRYDAA